MRLSVEIVRPTPITLQPTLIEMCLVYWTQNPDTELYQVAGFLDPLLAVQELEEARRNNGYIWIADDEIKTIFAVSAVSIQNGKVVPDRRDTTETPTVLNAAGVAALQGLTGGGNAPV